MLQWMAATRAARDIVYFPFGDQRVQGLQSLSEALLAASVTVGQVGTLLRIL